MKKLLAITSSALTMLSLQFYLHLNIIKPSGGHSGIEYLALSVALGAIVIFPSLLISKSYRWIQKPTALLIVFWLFVFYKFAYEHPDRGLLFASSIGSSGGIIFFFFIGSLLGLNPLVSGSSSSIKIISSSAYRSSKSLYDFLKVFALSIVAMNSTVLSLIEFSFYSSKIRADIFFVDSRLIGGDIPYQRIGDFLSIDLLISVLSTGVVLFSNYGIQGKSVAGMRLYLCSIFCSICALISCVLCFFTALLAGSNKGALLSACILFLLICLFYLKRKNHILMLVSSTRKLLDSIQKFRIKKRFVWVVSISATLSVLLGISTFLINPDLLKGTRLSRFGADDGILGPRIRLLVENFIDQFNVAPLLGHSFADGLTTGDGSYIHSLPVYLLIHTGLVGLILFFLFFYSHVRNKVIFINKCLTYPNPSVDLVRNLIGLYTIICALCIAIIGTSLFWGFLWFGIGLSFAQSGLLRQKQLDCN